MFDPKIFLFTVWGVIFLAGSLTFLSFLAHNFGWRAVAPVISGIVVIAGFIALIGYTLYVFVFSAVT